MEITTTENILSNNITIGTQERRELLLILLLLSLFFNFFDYFDVFFIIEVALFQLLIIIL